MKKLIHRAGGAGALGRAVWALSIKALPAFYGLGIIFVLLRALPVEEYGSYGVAWAFLNVAAMCTRGLWSFTLVQKWASGAGEQVLGALVGLSFGTTLLGIAAGYLILPALGLSMTETTLTCFALLVLVPRDLAMALAWAESRFRRVFIIEACYFMGSLLGFVILAQQGELTTTVSALAVNTGAIILSSVAGIIRHPIVLRPTFRLSDYKAASSYGKWTGVMAIGDIYFQQGDLLVLGAVLSPVILAPYIAAKTFLRLFALVSQAMNFLLYPMAARLAAEGDLPRLASKLRLALIGVWALGIPAALVLWAYADPVIPSLLGEKYVEAIPFVLALLVPALLEPLSSTGVHILVGLGQPRYAIPVIITVMVLNAVANLLLANFYDLSAAPWVLAASYLILGSVLQTRVWKVLRS
ncbi:MAG: oligosaccharide flippase family protein [Calditrichaeota bacterium]|nr:oligosaccharide flippase family protein [Calditrichota bacterium]